MLAGVIRALTTDLLLFAAVIVAFTHVARWAGGLRPVYRQMLIGAVLGAAAIGAMLTPADIGPARSVDARNVMLALSAPFGGLPGMLVTLVMTGAFRLYEGGPDTFASLASSAIGALLGYAVTLHAARRGRVVSFADLLLLTVAAIPAGWVVHYTIGNDEVGWFAAIGLPVAIAKALGIPLLGALLIGERDRHAILRSLAESERRYEAMAANVPGIVYRRVLSASGQLSFEYVSQGLLDLFGMPARLATLDANVIVSRMHAADREGYLASLKASAETLAPWAMDYRILHADGSERWMRARSTPRRRDDGATVWDGVVVDITDQKHSENELRNTNLALQDEIAQRHSAEQQRDDLIAELQRLSDTDPLTGALNRRGFARIVEHELRRLKRSEGTVALILLDLDHFKRVNDRFGHETGDRVLQQTAQACRTIIREVDCLGRLGGEEFAILLQDADEQAAWLVAMRLRGEFERLPLEQDGVTLPITASFGIVAAESGDVTLAEMLRAADDALYQAKAAGRNRVVRSSRGGQPAEVEAKERRSGTADT